MSEKGTAEDRVRSELARILASPQFVRAKRSSQLLEFLVSSALGGREQDLKEYTIGTEAFGKPESFDPRIDSLVRVEATRLRGRLESYYEIARDDEPVKILLPVGSYIPEFRQREAAVAEGAAPLAVRKPFRASSLWLAIALCLFALLAGWAVRHWMEAKRTLHFTTLMQVSLPGEAMASPALSAGNVLYFSSNRGGGHFRIWRHPLNGGDPQAMTAAEWDSTGLDLSPDGKWLTYWSGREGGGVYRQPCAGGSEEVISRQGLSPRYSADGGRILYWVRDPETAFGRVYVSRLPRAKYPPTQVATEFMDAHDPQWTPDGRILICGTLRTNVPSLEHDLWIVPATGAAAPVKTGILGLLNGSSIDLHDRSSPETSFRWQGPHLIFSASPPNRRARLFSLLFDLDAGRPAGPVRELIAQEAVAQVEPSLQGGRIVFASTGSQQQIWAIPLGRDGVASGKPVRITGDGSGDRFLPSVSADGARLAYLARRPPNVEIWLQELSSGVGREIASAPGIGRLRMSPDGNAVFFRLLEGSPPQNQQIRRIDLDHGGAGHTVCTDCGAPVAISPGGEFVVHETGSRLARLAVVRIADGERREIVEHPLHAVLAGAVSPDGRWIAFELDRSPEGRQIFVAPFGGLRPIARSDWTPVTAPEVSSFGPAWSPDGSALYFLSDRANRPRDLWRQALGPGKRNAGPPVRVYEFVDSALTPLTHDLRQPLYRIGLAVLSRRAILTLSQRSGSVWIGQLSQ